MIMEGEDEEDIYAPEESILSGQNKRSGNDETASESAKREGASTREEDEEEGEEVEEDESDSVGAASSLFFPKSLTLLPQDIDIITERKGVENAESLYEGLWFYHSWLNCTQATPTRPHTQGSDP